MDRIDRAWVEAKVELLNGLAWGISENASMLGVEADRDRIENFERLAAALRFALECERALERCRDCSDAFQIVEDTANAALASCPWRNDDAG